MVAGMSDDPINPPLEPDELLALVAAVFAAAIGFVALMAPEIAAWLSAS